MYERTALKAASTSNAGRRVADHAPAPSEELGAMEFIGMLHKELKPSWADRGLMLGTFHPGCDAEVLHNPEYRPLHTSEPLFFIRHMQLTDLPFLARTEQLIRSYCRNFKAQDRAQLECRITDARIPKLPSNWDSCMNHVFSGPKMPLMS